MITWFDKQQTKRTSQTGPDISVAVNKKNGKLSATVIAFRRNLENLITKTDYLKIGVSENRLYFMGADEKTGWKMVKKGCEQTARVACGTVLQDFVGDYDLMFEPNLRLYYIDKEYKK